ncbi:spindle and kinetochore-associated protein 2 isoform X4 [Panthera pardus]|uniref:Protein FAM33A n=1 Tax=Panthera pardus TaxID=9691 RepID=A0A9V1ER41_PANPR|nr:spindle and kinetochore-associated protein 2 isoform X4 [Panthera pardus]
MEAEVDKLELMRNPVTLLKELSTIKSRYQTLYARFKPIGIEQKESKNRICATVSKTMTMIQELQKQTDVELSPLTKEEKTAAEQLKSFVQTYEEVDLQKGILMERRSIPERFKKMSC